jgi:alpha-beta hydrolase superfamily lysophospholipase
MEPATVQEPMSATLTPLPKYQGNLQPKGFPPLPEGFVSETETFAGVEPKLQLFGVWHHPGKLDTKARRHRLAIIVHGYGEHGGRYLHVPHYLKSIYDSFYCLDLRGHGRSEGLRGHVDRFDHYAGDVALAIKRLQERFGNSPAGFDLDLIGHSMGGLVALRVAHLFPELQIRYLVVSAPLLGIAVPVSPIKTAAAKLLSHVWSTLHMGNEIDERLLSRDPEVGIAYRADRLVSSKGTPRWYSELLKTMADTMIRHDGIAWPILLLVPTADKIVDESHGLEYFAALKHPDKELHKYEGYYHEIFNDLGKERVFEDIIQWVKKHQSNA